MVLDLRMKKMWQRRRFCNNEPLGLDPIPVVFILAILQSNLGIRIFGRRGLSR